MTKRRGTFYLALGLLYCLCAGQTLAVLAAPPGGVSEVRLPVASPAETGAGSDLRFGSRSAQIAQNAQNGQVGQGVGIPTLLPTPESLRAENVTQPAGAQPPGSAPLDETPVQRPVVPPAPTPPQPGFMGTGPELRMGVTPPTPPALPEPLAPGPGPTPPPAAEPGPDQWKLTADAVSGQHGSEYIQAEGNAVITKGLNTLKADFMRYYQASRWVYLKGHVRVAWEGDILEAEEAEFDLTNMVGWLKNGKVFMGKQHVYFQSETVRKYGPSSYRFKEAKVTGCDGDKPAWSFTAEEGDVTLDGRTRLWHSRFNVADTPVAYSPFLSLPGAGKRQSGLLIPEISHSRVKGYTVNQAYYWAMSEEHDMTFYENVMSRRGLMQGLEYRHAEDPRSKGDWRVDFLRDKKTAAASSDEEDYLRGDGLTRPNKNRWWVRSKYNGFLGDPEWTLKVDVDAVSDQNYLREFNGGLSGFDSSRKSFLKEFGRDIEVADSLTRNSVALLSRSWERVGVTAKVGWTQNLQYMNGNSPGAKNPTVQSLPEVNAFAFKDSVLPGVPVDFEMGSRFNYFWRELGTRGSRVDLRPTLSLPLTFGPFTMIPSAGLRNTSYGIPKYSNEPGTTTTVKSPARTFPELGFTGFTEFHRVFRLGGGQLEPVAENVGRSEWLGLRHSVTPRVDFSYIPVPASQDRLPYFDSLDRLARKNLITYSVTNVLDRKRTVVSAAPSGNATIPVAATDYLDFLSLRLEQSYDRDEAARSQDLSLPRRPFSDVMAEVGLKPEKFVNLTSRTYYSPYLGRPTEHEHLLTLNKEGLGEIRFGHDYLYPLTEYKRVRTKDVQALRLGADYQITPRLKFTSDYRYDIAGHADLEKTAGFLWKDQCYELELVYKRKPSDQAVEFRFNLLDFGKQ